MIVASILTHLTARHSVARQNPESADTPQTAIMNKLTLYVFPLGVLLFGFFFPIGLLIYWLANNRWTLIQQRLVYKRIDAEEEEKKTEAIEKRSNLAPKPGAKPDQAKKRTAPAPGTKPPSDAKPAPNAKAAGTARASRTSRSPVRSRRRTRRPQAPSGRSRTARPSRRTAKPADNGAESKDGSTVSGLSSDRSRKKNTGRKNR